MHKTANPHVPNSLKGRKNKYLSEMTDLVQMWLEKGLFDFHETS